MRPINTHTHTVRKHPTKKKGGEQNTPFMHTIDSVTPLWSLSNSNIHISSKYDAVLIHVIVFNMCT